jgi:hypothetical protein
MIKPLARCPHCDHGPVVESTDQEVRIGEAGGLAAF